MKTLSELVKVLNFLAYFGYVDIFIDEESKFFGKGFHQALNEVIQLDTPAFASPDPKFILMGYLRSLTILGHSSMTDEVYTRQMGYVKYLF